MLCRYESYMHVPAASYYLIPISYKPLVVYMLALRVLVHAQVVSNLSYNLIWICYFQLQPHMLLFNTVGMGYN